jgi:hypothetical protein
MYAIQQKTIQVKIYQVKTYQVCMYLCKGNPGYGIARNDMYGK